MHKSLLSFYPDPDEVLALAPNDLGDLILSELWGHYEKLNRNNSANDMADPYPRDYRDRISRAALEAWSWLVNQQFIAETNENGWFFVTRRGDERREMLVRLRDEAANPRTL